MFVWLMPALTPLLYLWYVPCVQLPPPNVNKPSVKLSRFPHVPGCRVCEGVYKHYVLPDGRAVHYYHDDSLNELVLDHVVVPPKYPLALGDIGLVLGFPEPPPPVRPIKADMPKTYIPHKPIGTPQPQSVSLPAPERLTFEVRAQRAGAWAWGRAA